MDTYEYAEPDGLVDRLRAWDADIDDLLEESQASAEARLAEELERIEEQLEARDAVHEEIVDELEFKVEWYTDRLESLYKIGRGRKEGTRERLQNRIEAFYEELRQEQRQHWQDRQNLEQERRDLLRELAEVENTSVEDLL
jgi:hypothetical protein